MVHAALVPPVEFRLSVPCRPSFGLGDAPGQVGVAGCNGGIILARDSPLLVVEVASSDLTTLE